ncbi:MULTISPECIES: glycerol-3-phosphate 1-O-acyltransferase PlsY [unclassified Facklamia]|uniref:glycerol-3-phosphate 1-O-acyltransferase PlsY n=1 Tax=Aerococcaceae TaxID=186827 RepID=UPI0013BBD535|nr:MULTISPECIES: glycerol-3-phosphate 1-O-acyltransferase PlsY [unclassified Facklamia]NEW64412.1 glycerol-3-phosphate 1-O-acyltransferase PlsY [Facklamia sp. 252]NEW68493.1 glycerol-3-phosphate 1-O-acyltransferase PlsY [Facklamia sp. 253]QQD64872.1 glycerol-3-phosphate 1-O-acyltransferase PlsY [Aerococcaceae bacterium zg-252]
MHYLYLIFAYLIGSIPTGVWYSRYKHRVDVRELGSGNSGATNVGRNFGIKAAVFVTLIDIFKGTLVVLLAKHFFPNEPYIIMGSAIAAVLGHAYPLYANFKGGKVVATSFGVTAGFSLPIAFFGALFLFLLIYLTSTISLSAMVSFTATALYIYFTQASIYGYGFLLIALFLMYRHRANIQRLMQGNESHIGFGLRSSKK